MTASPTGAAGQGARIRELEAALGAIRDYVVITLDSDGNVASWNADAEAMRGYAAEDVVGKPVSFLYTEEDQAAGVPERDLRAAREAGRSESEGWRFRKDGSRFWAGAVIAPVRGKDGAVSGFVKATRDLTERRQSEAMFNGLFESAPDAMVIVGPDGRVALANRQAEELFGYSRDELAGMEVEALVPERLRGRHPSYRTGYFTAPRVRPMGTELDLYGLRKDGSEFPVEISLSPLQTYQGLLVSTAIRDVTERREQELRLQLQRDEILELSTPVIQIWDKVLALPIIGTLDSVRAARLTEQLLGQIAEHQAEVVILDISGVPTIDTQVAQHLLRTVQAATLMGAESVLCGVRPETAQAIVHLGIDMGRLRSRTTLRDALHLAMQITAEHTAAAARQAQQPLAAGGQA